MLNSESRNRSTLTLPVIPHLRGFCGLCGERLFDEELDDDLCELFLGVRICFDCAALYRRWMAD